MKTYEFEKFYARVSVDSKGYFSIPVPKLMAQYVGLEKGDRIKVIFRKIGGS